MPILTGRSGNGRSWVELAGPTGKVNGLKTLNNGNWTVLDESVRSKTTQSERSSTLSFLTYLDNLKTQ